MTLDPSENIKPGLFRKILMALALAALGYCGNYLNIQVAFNVDFIFGSIFAIIAVAIMGLWWGIGISIIASSYTYLLWNQPYAIITFAAEILWIGVALRRGKKNILLIDSLFWLILGAPVIIAFYFGIMHFDAQSVTIVLLKQALNGIFNAMMAGIILSYTPLRKWTQGEAATGLPTYSTIIFHLVSVSLMLPSLSLLLYMNHRETASQQSRMVASLQADAYEARAFIQTWVSVHVNAARGIASLKEQYPRPSAELQRELLQISKLFPDYRSLHLGDADATAIAFYPPINERGESTIGINYADRDWFRQLKDTLKPVVSDVFRGRTGVFVPIFTIGVPVVRDGKLVGYGLGAVNLQKLSDRLAAFSHGDVLTYSILDRNGNLIASSDKTRKPLLPVADPNKRTVLNISPDVSLWVPGPVKNVARMLAWKGAYYFNRLPIDETTWTLLTEQPIAPLQKHLYSLTIWGLSGVAVLYALSMLFALILSRRLARTTKSLASITKDIPLKIDQQETIAWPVANTAEMAQLTNNFRDAESSLRKYIQEVRHANEALEEKVQERTAELQRERQRLGNILHGTNAGTWEWNVQTGEASFNELWANISGFSLNELAPVNIQTWFDLVHPDDLQASREMLEKHFSGEIDYYEFECRMRHKDGHWVWVVDRGKVASRTKDGKPLTMSGTRQDITKRKRAEEALQASKAQLANALEMARLGHWEYDVASDLFTFNDQFYRLFRTTAEQVGGYTMHSAEYARRFVHPDDIAVVGEETRKAIETTDPHFHRQLEHRILYADGSVGYISVRFFIVKDSQGKTIKTSGVNQDITERKRAEAEKEKLEAQNRQLQKAESLSRMAGAIAHHFNNQLGVVIGNLDLAMNNLYGASGPNKFLLAAMKSAGQAAEMSGLMLTYLGQTHDQQEPLDLSEICRLGLRMLSATQPKGVVFKTDLPSPGPTVRANASQLQQLLINLVTNAWEAIGDGQGAINIAVKTVSPTAIPGSHRFPIGWQMQQGDYACLEVADNGGGIAANDIEKLFDPFYSSKFTGRGLGLAVVLGIVREHHGGVTVESEPGNGSIFKVFLPVADEKISRQPEKEAATPQPERVGTVLLVEDEQAMRKMAATMITFIGYTVVEAADGAEAVEKFKQLQDEIRCVLCDLTMPRMGGWETLAALRKLSPNIPFIIASGYDKASVMSGYHAEWPQAFLGKPYNLKGLTEAINLAMAKKS